MSGMRFEARVDVSEELFAEPSSAVFAMRAEDMAARVARDVEDQLLAEYERRHADRPAEQPS